MLRRDRLIRMQIHQLMDACLCALSFWLAYLLRSNPDILDMFNLDPISPFKAHVWLLVVLMPAGPLILEAQGFYSRPLVCSRGTTFWLLFKGCFFTTLVLILAHFFSPRAMSNLVARSVIIWSGGIIFGLILLKEELLRLAFQSKLGQAQYRRRFILVGTGEETARMRAELKDKSHEAIEILAELDLNTTPLQNLVDMLHEYSVNGVILSTKHAYFEQAEAVIRACELEGVEAWLVAELLVMFLLAWWLFPLIALVIKLTSPGPVLFRQQRSGLNGHPFTIYKFRTMVTNAEQFQHELAAMNEMRGPVFKLSKDPRITPVGRFLRKFSIDEWPQFYNVLRGEMSLVGPRPLPVDEVKRFHDLAHRRRLSVKPGLTCLWQVSGRNDVSDFKDWVRLDLEYIDNWSLWLDLKILWRTVPAVLAGTGAK